MAALPCPLLSNFRAPGPILSDHSNGAVELRCSEAPQVGTMWPGHTSSCQSCGGTGGKVNHVDLSFVIFCGLFSRCISILMQSTVHPFTLFEFSCTQIYNDIHILLIRRIYIFYEAGCRLLLVIRCHLHRWETPLGSYGLTGRLVICSVLRKCSLLACGMVLCAKIELVGLKSKEAHMTCLKPLGLYLSVPWWCLSGSLKYYCICVLFAAQTCSFFCSWLLTGCCCLYNAACIRMHTLARMTLAKH